MAASVQENSLFTTIRYQQDLLHSETNTRACNGVATSLYLLAYHAQRLTEAKRQVSGFSQHAGARSHVDPRTLSEACMEAVQQWHEDNGEVYTEALRLRASITPAQKLSVEVSAALAPLRQQVLFPAAFILDIDESQPPAWEIRLDRQYTEATEATRYKTSDRQAYNRARHDAGITSPAQCREVLLQTADGCILDGSITTPYFHREGRWVTPAASCGGLQGTARRYALENNLCEEGLVRVDSLRDHEIVWLSNAVRGFFAARFMSSAN